MGFMARSNRPVHRWNGEPGISRRGDLDSTLNSAFSTPSRIERKRIQKLNRKRDYVLVGAFGLAVLLMALVVLLIVRSLHR
jgi:type IV secretory pathway component VirB8